MPKAVLLCVAGKKGYAVLKDLSSQPARGGLHVCTFRESLVSDHYDERIKDLAAHLGAQIVSWNEFRTDPIAHLQTRGIGSLLCIAWRYLIPQIVLDFLPGKVVVAHDSLLPKLRGFAPLPTAMIAGESQTGVTFLRACASLDQGDILWQQAVDIAPTDTISKLIDKLCPLYVEGANLFLQGRLRDGRKQDESQATYSIWRDNDDYRIDWFQDAATIERQTRALGPPYLGAQTILGDQLIHLHEVQLVPDLVFAIRQPGKIWSLDSDGRPIVVCGKGMIHILKASCNNTDAFPLRSLRQRFR